MRAFALLLIAAALAACGPSPFPMADATSDADGKLFRHPAPGRSAVYVYTERHGAIEMTLGQRNLGTLADHSWLRVDVPPGPQDLRCRLLVMSSVPAVQRLDLSAGQVVYVSTNFVHLSDPPCRLTIEPADVAQPAILARARVRETSGASD